MGEWKELKISIREGLTYNFITFAIMPWRKVGLAPILWSVRYYILGKEIYYQSFNAVILQRHNLHTKLYMLMCIAWGVLRWVMAVTTANAINIANIFKSLLLISVKVMRWLWCHVCVYIIQSSIREVNMARRNREKERSITWVCQSLDFALTEGKITQFDWKSGLPLLPSKTIANYYD